MKKKGRYTYFLQKEPVGCIPGVKSDFVGGWGGGGGIMKFYKNNIVNGLFLQYYKNSIMNGLFMKYHKQAVFMKCYKNNSS